MTDKPIETRTPEQIEREDYPASASVTWEKEWATAESWRRLSLAGPLHPGEEICFDVGPVTPHLVKSIVAMSECLPNVRVQIILMGKLRLADDARFDMDRIIHLPIFLLLPRMRMQVNVRNAGDKSGAFRALICGMAIKPAQAIDFYMNAPPAKLEES